MTPKRGAIFQTPHYNFKKKRRLTQFSFNLINVYGVTLSVFVALMLVGGCCPVGLWYPKQPAIHAGELLVQTGVFANFFPYNVRLARDREIWVPTA